MLRRHVRADAFSVHLFSFFEWKSADHLSLTIVFHWCALIFFFHSKLLLNPRLTHIDVQISVSVYDITVQFVCGIT